MAAGLNWELIAGAVGALAAGIAVAWKYARPAGPAVAPLVAPACPPDGVQRFAERLAHMEGQLVGVQQSLTNLEVRLRDLDGRVLQLLSLLKRVDL